MESDHQQHQILLQKQLNTLNHKGEILFSNGLSAVSNHAPTSTFPGHLETIKGIVFAELEIHNDYRTEVVTLLDALGIPRHTYVQFIRPLELCEPSNDPWYYLEKWNGVIAPDYRAILNCFGYWHAIAEESQGSLVQNDIPTLVADGILPKLHEYYRLANDPIIETGLALDETNLTLNGAMVYTFSSKNSDLYQIAQKLVNQAMIVQGGKRRGGKALTRSVLTHNPLIKLNSFKSCISQLREIRLHDPRITLPYSKEHLGGSREGEYQIVVLN